MRLVRRGALFLGLLGAGGCGDRRPSELAIKTVPLPPPTGNEPVFETSIALDPSRPDRIVVGAQYGVGYNRGGRRVWSWQSRDGGRSWSGSEIPLPKTSATLAADVVTGFGVDGSPYLGLLFADSSFHGGLAVTRADSAELQFGPALVAVPDRLDAGEGAVDKPWLSIDQGSVSPLRGNAYLSFHLNRPLPNHGVASSLWLTSSRAGGATWAEPLKIADQFGGQVAVRGDGTVDLLFGEGTALLHRSSIDGARTFGGVDTVMKAPAGRTLDNPSVVAAPNGTLVACWADDSASDQRFRLVRCVTGSETVGWSAPTRLDSTGAAYGLPAVSANGTTVWALAYRSDSSRTDVMLYRSDDQGRRFHQHAILATRPFGISKICLTPSGSCRRAPPESGIFFPGDYVGLSAGPGRVVAAFVLPDGDAPTGRPTAFVSIVRVD